MQRKTATSKSCKINWPLSTNKLSKKSVIEELFPVML